MKSVNVLVVGALLNPQLFIRELGKQHLKRSLFTKFRPQLPSTISSVRREHMTDSLSIRQIHLRFYTNTV